MYLIVKFDKNNILKKYLINTKDKQKIIYSHKQMKTFKNLQSKK